MYIGKPQGLYVAIADFDASKEKDKTSKVSLQSRESVRVVKEDDSGLRSKSSILWSGGRLLRIVIVTV